MSNQLNRQNLQYHRFLAKWLEPLTAVPRETLKKPYSANTDTRVRNSSTNNFLMVSLESRFVPKKRVMVSPLGENYRRIRTLHVRNPQVGKFQRVQTSFDFQEFWADLKIGLGRVY